MLIAHYWINMYGHRQSKREAFKGFDEKSIKKAGEFAQIWNIKTSNKSGFAGKQSGLKVNVYDHCDSKKEAFKRFDQKNIKKARAFCTNMK